MANSDLFAHGPITDHGWFMAMQGPVLFTHMNGRLDDASFNRFLETFTRELDERDLDRKICVLYHVPEPAAANALRRKKMAEVLATRRHRTAMTCAAYAMVTPVAIVRGMTKALFWLAPPPYPHEIVETTLQGLTFVARHLPTIDPASQHRQFAALLAQVESSLPRVASR